MSPQIRKITTRSSHMDKKNNSGGNGFNVFILGIFIGVLATLLLTTKKGRKILKVIIDEGTERISKWEDVIDSLKTQVEEDVDLEDEPIMGEKVVQIEDSKEPEGVKETKESEKDTQETEVEEGPPLHAAVAEKKEPEVEEKEPAPKKKSRFFKGTRKK